MGCGLFYGGGNGAKIEILSGKVFVGSLSLGFEGLVIASDRVFNCPGRTWIKG